MVRIAIVEDDAKTAAKIEGYVRRYCEENRLQEECAVFHNGMEIAGEYQPRWDIILLDIEMPLMNGMETAREIRRQDETVVVIFITSMAQYAIQGYQVNALDYLLKPVEYTRLAAALSRALKVVQRNETKYLLLPVEGIQKRVAADEIFYVEVANHSLRFVGEKECFQLRGSLSGAEKMLEGCHFSRCNQCYLVNLRWVTQIGRETVQVQGHSLSISRPRRKAFLQEYADYLGVEL